MKVTTNATIQDDLAHTLRARTWGVQAGTTWGSFKRAMAQLGVDDDDRLASVEFGCKQGGSGHLLRDDAVDGIEIRER